MTAHSNPIQPVAFKRKFLSQRPSVWLSPSCFTENTCRALILLWNGCRQGKRNHNLTHKHISTSHIYAREHLRRCDVRKPNQLLLYSRHSAHVTQDFWTTAWKALSAIESIHLTVTPRVTRCMWVQSEVRRNSPLTLTRSPTEKGFVESES